MTRTLAVTGGVLLLVLVAGCGDDEEAARAERERLLARLDESHRRLDEVRQEGRRGVAGAQRQAAEAEEEASAARWLWGVSGLALALVLALLAREHRLRRVLERLVARILGERSLPP